jgi:hypothetical protein
MSARAIPADRTVSRVSERRYRRISGIGYCVTSVTHIWSLAAERRERDKAAQAQRWRSADARHPRFPRARARRNPHRQPISWQGGSAFTETTRAARGQIEGGLSNPHLRTHPERDSPLLGRSYLSAMPSRNARSWRIPPIHWIDFEGQERVNLLGSPGHRRMAAICAKRTSGEIALFVCSGRGERT